MEPWLLQFLVEKILEWFPDTALNPPWEAYLPATRTGSEACPNLPPARAKMILARWLEYPDFYTDFARRMFLILPVENHVRVAAGIELDIIVGALQEYPEIFTVSDDWPLPVVTISDEALLASARYDFEASLSSSFDLSPSWLGRPHGYIFWLFAFALRTLFAAYLVDQLANRVLKAGD